MGEKNQNATIHPIDDQILVRRATPDVEGVTPEVLRGAIAAMGPGMPTITGERSPLTVIDADRRTVGVCQGDGIIYRTESAQKLTLESGDFDLIRFRDAIAVLKVDKQR